MIRKTLLWLLLGLLLLAVWYYKLIAYGLGQAHGQLSIIWAAREFEEVLQDPEVHDSIKYKLNLIHEVKQYTVENLGYEPSKNYTTFYDQKGQPSLWVVTGAQPYQLEAKEWYFPFLGEVPYKGFFDYTKALKEEQALASENYDTNLRVAGGWSTLGWFRDPVLSNMLSDHVGNLVNTIIHELTHENLFIKDSVEFNENIASFFGDQGAQQFLIRKFGSSSLEYRQYLAEQEDRHKFTDHILRGADQLDSLYQQLMETKTENTRYNFKKQAINEIILTFDTLSLNEKQRYRDFLHSRKINNAFFMSYLRYRGDFTFFEKELANKFNGDLGAYFQHFKEIMAP